MQFQSQYGAAAQQVLHVHVLLQHPFWSTSSSSILNCSQDRWFDNSFDAAALLMICFPKRLAAHSCCGALHVP
jgi:hypothetical protein